MERLPLFPLGTVLVPGAPLGLQIFEPRYIAMLTDLLGEEAQEVGVTPEFGVVCIRRGFEVGEGIRDVHEVGTVARIRQVGLIGENVFGLVAVGTDRFRLHGLDETAATPYLSGLVERLDEPVGDEERATALSDQVVAAVITQLDARGEALSDDGRPPDDPTGVSWWAPQVLELEPSEAQLLLAAPDTETRLGMVLRTAKRETQLETDLGVTMAPRFGPPASWN
ncbi:LON peptidase substrate-binding domain-containing protein [Lapillicoccus jejuensis]|uniref:Lon N-terminal domain-containing protein n=1 Tax=Lapillicoccus jejuensis TaxID=402171 RepID=A0A542DZU4_9MICO|nr:LON peptidase substrate-binding domain-containing protein [Lapillicoccus jejuensis]TQJ08627.1 hypothetical protein FB458_1718 [Lapillicoccus jejuensis]